MYSGGDTVRGFDEEVSCLRGEYLSAVPREKGVNLSLLTYVQNDRLAAAICQHNVLRPLVKDCKFARPVLIYLAASMSTVIQ